MTNPADKILFQLPILLMHVLQSPMSAYSMHTVLVPVDAETYIGNSNK